MERKINIDYIGVVKENNGHYTYEQVDIQESKELFVTLDAMCKNPNRTVLEMQDCFTAHFGVKPKTAYDCCLPYDYDSSYIGYVCLPEKMTIEQYRQGKQEVAEKARREFEDRAKNSPFVTSFSQEQAEREIAIASQIGTRILKINSIGRLYATFRQRTLLLLRSPSRIMIKYECYPTSISVGLLSSIKLATI